MKSKKVALKSSTPAALIIASILSGSTLTVNACESTGIEIYASTPISALADHNILIIDQQTSIDWLKDQLQLEDNNVETVIFHGNKFTSDFFLENNLDASLLKSAYIAPTEENALNNQSFKHAFGEKHQIGDFVIDALSSRTQTVIKTTDNPLDILLLGPVEEAITTSLITAGHNVMIGTARDIKTAKHHPGITTLGRFVDLLQNAENTPIVLAQDYVTASNIYPLDKTMDRLQMEYDILSSMEEVALLGIDIQTNEGFYESMFQGKKIVSAEEVNGEVVLVSTKDSNEELIALMQTIPLITSIA